MQFTTLRLFKVDQHIPASTPQLFEEPSLFYQPPYHTMLEDDLAWHLTKYLADEAALQHNATIRTLYADYNVDFLVEFGKQRIGFMCGQMDWDTDHAIANFKDALLIDAGGVDVLYRFDTADLQERMHDCLQLVAAWNPALFSQRGLVNLAMLASTATTAFQPSFALSQFTVTLDADLEENKMEDEFGGEVFAWPRRESDNKEIHFRRMCRHHPAAWMAEYERALLHYGVSEDVLRQKWARSA